MNIRLIFIVLTLSLNSACKQNTTYTSNSEQNDTYPAWVLNPQINGFVAVSASAPKQKMGGDYAQRRVALTKARQQLAEQIRVRVEAQSIDSIEVANGIVTTRQSMKARIHSLVMLNMGNARIINEWVHPNSGELYIHYITETVSGI